jgi:hypothetical protein
LRLRSTDCSVVPDNGNDPRPTRGCCQGGIGRRRRAAWPGATGQSAQPLPSHILLNGQIQGYDTSRKPIFMRWQQFAVI